MKNIGSIRWVALMIVAFCAIGCQSTGHAVRVHESEVQGFQVKTYVDSRNQIEVTVASDGDSTIVAVPTTPVALDNQMGDSEYTCLKACKDIADLEKRLNCILLCPVTKYRVAILR